MFPEKPAKPPLPGARYGSFPAAGHYLDGTFVPQALEDRCAPRSPQSGARFSFWHPDLVTLHVWLWYPNPAGLYHGTNPLIRPFNHGQPPAAAAGPRTRPGCRRASRHEIECMPSYAPTIVRSQCPQVSSRPVEPEGPTWRSMG